MSFRITPSHKFLKNLNSTIVKEKEPNEEEKEEEPEQKVQATQNYIQKDGCFVIKQTTSAQSDYL